MSKIIFVSKDKNDKEAIDRANDLLTNLSKEEKVLLSSEACHMIKSTGIIGSEDLIEHLEDSEANRVMITASSLMFLVELEKIGLISIKKAKQGGSSPVSSEGRQQTFGEKAVGLGFNPAKDPKVQQIKESFAKTIDYLENERKLVQSEHAVTFDQIASRKEKLRQLSIAITEAQTSQMWAVKSLTWR